MHRRQSPTHIDVNCSGSPAIESLTFFSGAEFLSVVDMRNCTSNKDEEIIITLFYFYKKLGFIIINGYN